MSKTGDASVEAVLSSPARDASDKPGASSPTGVEPAVVSPPGGDRPASAGGVEPGREGQRGTVGPLGRVIVAHADLLDPDQ